VNKFDSIANHLEPIQTQESTPTAQQENTLRAEVERSLSRYFKNIEDEPVTDLHHMVISEVEAPLIEAVMGYCGNNKARHLSCLV
tara:strand:- start:181 stop:435 length:255 start_codon:yes stop_codon:yes gene_type:complete